MPVVTVTFDIGPFYSCLLSDLPLNGIEAAGDLVLIQTSLLLICKSSCSNAN